MRPSPRPPASIRTPVVTAPAIASPVPIPIVTPVGFNSVIVRQFPALLAEFGRKHVNLLWRGGRDGFSADQFHVRCDGRAKTLLLIEDTDGNIFGGFTPVKWNCTSGYKPDPSLKSFLFTLKNPHNFAGRRFPLKGGQTDKAILCSSSYGPHFCDFGVSNDCDTTTNSYTSHFGSSYANDTGVDGSSVFTGSGNFKVKEIEVFEIITIDPASASKTTPTGFYSTIVYPFPALFAEFWRRRFDLLWRGSRDGFGAPRCHARCDRHANTLTLIEDTGGNIFGGFTPAEWDSPWFGREKYMSDESLKSFIFTLKNPHNFPAKKFALKAEQRDRAIICDSSRGPNFGDIYVSDHCNANNHSCISSFGSSYTNDTRLYKSAFFASSAYFRVKEIEVFEIIG
jgi:hypothetical protein